MTIHDFILKNWFDLLQSIFIVGGFILTFLTLRNDIRSRKVENLLLINQSCRDIWNKAYSDPKLFRIREPNLDLEKHPITDTERRMVREAFTHIYGVFEAVNNKQIEIGEMEKDIYDYIHLPIPNIIWEEVRIYHNKRFVKFIEELQRKERREVVKLI